MVLFVSVERLLGERPTKRVRRIDLRFDLLTPNLRVHVGETLNMFSNSILSSGRYITSHIT
ncbi:hypothetical protein C5B91_21790 [Haloferax sp. Atlit-10N]|nr:hypothetical protein C5B91_21790 [Haloferax sp. Atlit-10N]